MKSTYHGKSKWDSIKEEDKSNFSIAAMIMGIVALVFSCIKALSFLSVLALLLSVYSMIGEHNSNRGMAVAGLTTSIVAVCIGIFVQILF